MSAKPRPKPKKLCNSNGKAFWVCPCGLIVPESSMAIFQGSYVCLTCIAKKKGETK